MQFHHGRWPRNCRVMHRSSSVISRLSRFTEAVVSSVANPLTSFNGRLKNPGARGPGTCLSTFSVVPVTFRHTSLLIHIREARKSDHGSRALHREGSDLCFALISSERFASSDTFYRGEPVGNSDAAPVTFQSSPDEESVV